MFAFGKQWTNMMTRIIKLSEWKSRKTVFCTPKIAQNRKKWNLVLRQKKQFLFEFTFSFARMLWLTFINVPEPDRKQYTMVFLFILIEIRIFSTWSDGGEQTKEREKRIRIPLNMFEWKIHFDGPIRSYDYVSCCCFPKKKNNNKK